jgi:hypothetical protein
MVPTTMMSGVVTIKALTNGLLAALYTTGLLRVVRPATGAVICETNITSQEQEKILEAKIDSVSYNAHFEGAKMCKSIKIAVSA